MDEKLEKEKLQQLKQDILVHKKTRPISQLSLLPDTDGWSRDQQVSVGLEGLDIWLGYGCRWYEKFQVLQMITLGRLLFALGMIGHGPSF